MHCVEPQTWVGRNCAHLCIGVARFHRIGSAHPEVRGGACWLHLARQNFASRLWVGLAKYCDLKKLAKNARIGLMKVDEDGFIEDVAM